MLEVPSKAAVSSNVDVTSTIHVSLLIQYFRHLQFLQPGLVHHASDTGNHPAHLR